MNMQTKIVVETYIHMNYGAVEPVDESERKIELRPQSCPNWDGQMQTIGVLQLGRHATVFMTLDQVRRLRAVLDEALPRLEAHAAEVQVKAAEIAAKVAAFDAAVLGAEPAAAPEQLSRAATDEEWL